MRYLPLALAGLLVAPAAVAQTPPAPPGAPAASAADAAPPPPPPDPGAPGPDGPPPRGPGAPPPPPRGADIRFDRGPGTDLHLHVHCAEADTTKACADLTEQLADKLNLVVQAK